MALASTLSSLVPGAVEGLLREVVVVDIADADLIRVADHAGCRVATTHELIGQAAQIKGEWILLVDAGERLHSNWVELAGLHHGSQAGGNLTAARFRPVQPQPFWRWWRQGSQGALLLPKAHLVAHLRTKHSLDGAAKGLTIQRLRERRD